MRVLALSEYSKQVASARARVYAYEPRLRRDGHRVTVVPIHRTVEGGALVDLVAKRLLPFAAPAVLPWFDVVLVHRFFPSGAWSARLLQRVATRVVFDVDESYHVDHLGAPVPARMQTRFDAMLRAADGVIVSNEYLHAYAGRHARSVSIVPTPVDVDRYRLRTHRARTPTVIGWIGSGGAQQYLDMLAPVFAKLHARYSHGVVLEVITSSAYRVHLDTPLAVRHVTWDLAHEFAFFDRFDIGIMPLPDNERSRGKASYKALEYMAAGVPVVASPVGMNTAVVAPGVTGYLASSEHEWFEALCTLIDSPATRQAIGGRGRAFVAERFAVDVCYPRFKAALFGGSAA